MLNLYDFQEETADDVAGFLAGNLKKRRLEKGLSRAALSLMSGVPVPTIAKFEQKGAISLISFIALAKALGYTSQLKALLSEAQFHTMEELDLINKNKNRKRGRNETNR